MVAEGSVLICLSCGEMKYGEVRVVEGDVADYELGRYKIAFAANGTALPWCRIVVAVLCLDNYLSLFSS